MVKPKEAKKTKKKKQRFTKNITRNVIPSSLEVLEWQSQLFFLNKMNTRS